MKLINVDFYLDWPVSLKVINLREYVIKILVKKGEIVRWSIIDIQNSIDNCHKKKLRINAVLIN